MTVISLTERQERFCELVAAGIAPACAAYSAGYRKKSYDEVLLGREDIKEHIRELEKRTPQGIADPAEVLQMLTSVMRGHVGEPVVVVEQITGKTGKTERAARVIEKKPSVHERMSAAGMLARRYGILDGDESESIVIIGEEKLTDGVLDGDEAAIG